MKSSLATSFNIATLIYALLAFSSCAKGPDSADSVDKFFPGVPGISIPVGAVQNPNPRYPWANEYSNSANGYFSVVGTALINYPTTQTFFGFAAADTGTLVAIKRLDASFMSWVDLYAVPLAASSAPSTTMSLRCSIRFDGYFSSGFSYDQGYVYFTGTMWPYTIRKFSASTCAESTALNFPTTPTGWIYESHYQIFQGAFVGVYSQATVQSLRSYNSISGQLTTVVQSKSWADYSIDFSQNFSRTTGGAWGINTCGYWRKCIYFANSKGASFGYLPDSEYPDLSNNGNSFTFVLSAPSDTVAYVCAVSSTALRIYRIDTVSF